MKKKDDKIEQGGFIQHPSLNKLPNVIMQLPKLFYYDTYQWTIAVNQAKRWDWTRRTQLYDLYESCMLDSHLYGIIRQRRIAMSRFPITFVDKNGEPDDIINEQIKAPWFRSFLKTLLDEELYGFNAYQFYLDENGWMNYTQIDHRHIQPFTKQVLQMQTSLTGEPLENFSNTLFLGKPENIGVLATVVPWVLWKRQSLGDWTQFSQIFGMPIREYTYDAGDDKARNQLISDAQEQGANAVYIHPKESDLKLIESGNKAATSDLFKTLRDTCNEEMSLLILGNTLTSTSAEHGTQALGSVHEDQLNAIAEEDRGYVLDVLNYYMTDIFANLGFNTEGGSFIYKEEKEIDLYAQINIVTQLANMGLPMSDDYLYETFNIEKPADYDQQKADKEAQRQAMLESLKNAKGSGDAAGATQDHYASKRALGFFGGARRPNTDW